VSGYQIVTGIDDQTIKEGAAAAFDAGADLYVLLIPAAAVAVIIIAGLNFTPIKRSGLAVGVYLAAGLVGLVVLFLKFAHMQSDLADAQQATRSLVEFGYKPGWWIVLAGSALLLVAGYLGFQADERLRQRPAVAQMTHIIRLNGLQLGIVAVMVIMWIAFIVKAPGTFLDTLIYRALMISIPMWGIIALPLTMVVIAGEIDLSFPSTMAVGMVAFFEIYSREASLGLAFAGSLGAGFLVGLLNGIIIVRLRIPSLIATIGAQFFWRGLVDIVRKGQGESMMFTNDSLMRNMLVKRVNDYFPAQVIWMVVVGIIVWIILNRHKFGAHVYLIGDNEDSARLMGVNVGVTRVMLFALVGLAAAFAGVIQCVDTWYFYPNMGEGYLMTTLAAVFLGGTSVYGGTGSVFGTFIACFIIGAIQPGIIAVGLDGYYTKLIYGLIITASVAMHTLLRKRLE
jgi:simple sugar transport system permease protein